MPKQEGSPLHSPEDMLALAERLSARHDPAGEHIRAPLPPWLRQVLSFLGGAALTGLFWWATA